MLPFPPLANENRCGKYLCANKNVSFNNKACVKKANENVQARFEVTEFRVVKINQHFQNGSITKTTSRLPSP